MSVIRPELPEVSEKMVSMPIMTYEYGGEGSDDGPFAAVTQSNASVQYAKGATVPRGFRISKPRKQAPVQRIEWRRSGEVLQAWEADEDGVAWAPYPEPSERPGTELVTVRTDGTDETSIRWAPA